MNEFKLCGVRFRYTGIRNYYISECGDVASVTNNKILLMKPTMTKDNHLRIELKIKKGKAKKFFIHRLVYSSFCGELKPDFVIEHLDSNGIRNYYKNLKQSTQKENIRTCIKQNRRVGNKKSIYVKNKLTGEIEIYPTIKDLYAELGIKNSNNSLNKLIKHSKFKQKYEFIKTVKVKRLSKA